ncbi:MAG: hypothetical protein MI923_09975 [Phycisphaerales bacterium]|nr:hypothetical protein [Phycisphaerales bacterium]
MTADDVRVDHAHSFGPRARRLGAFVVLRCRIRGRRAQMGNIIRGV